jgi:ParB family chromosome partitioning protein
MIVNINSKQILNFNNYPFKIEKDENMQELINSIVNYGILTPLLVRPKENGYYEIISGHRRKYVADFLDIMEIPCIIKEMSDDEAIINMVDSNIQRENILPSEKAFAYKMKLDAIKHQGKIVVFASNPMEWKLENAEIIAKKSSENVSNVRKYIRLANLIPELLELVDNKQIAFRPAVELSYLSEENQYVIQNIFEFDEKTPSLSQAIRLKNLEQEGELTEEKIEEIMQEEKANQKQCIKIHNDKIEKYIPKKFKENGQTEEFIIKCVKQYLKNYYEKL